MARLAISKDYFPAYARLPRKAQRKADEFLVKFQRDSAESGMHVEPIHALDRQLRSARIGDDYRVILRAPETGDVFLVLWVDHHDEAYRWAASKQTAIHPTTGTLQIFDAELAARALTEPREEVVADAASLPPALFAPWTDDELFLAGVPRPLLPSVRSLASDEDLDRLLPHLPSEAGEVLTGLAAGVTLDQALEEVLGRVASPVGAPTPPLVDIGDVAAALEREPTQRQFRLFDGSIDLDAALKHPLDIWRVFLHPRQRRLARAETKGPMRVLGGAGTGKTVVALHRVAHLVREVFTKPDDRVLFTTFTVNLAQDLRAQLAKLLEPDQLARIEVTNIDKWAFEYLRRRGVVVRIAYDDDQRDTFRSAFEIYGTDDFTLDFARAEWREVIQDQGITTEQGYVLAVRRHRGTPLSRGDRRKLWPVFAAYRDQLEQHGLFEPLDVIRRARDELANEAGTPPRYRSVVVDETQDFSRDALQLVRSLAGPEHPDDLFMVGDAHQRIYGRPVSLSSCGIQVRGRRSQTLRLNYRTTGSICRWSFATLADVEVDDLDEGRADRRGYVSLREGAAPTIRISKSQTEEERDVVAIVRDAISRGVAPEAICVIARTHGPLKDRFEPALTVAGIDAVILDQEEPRRPAVRLATMHRVKGLEFSVVVLAAASKDSLPLQSAELRSDDPSVAAAALLRERCLVYVATSRARDELYVTAAGVLTSLVPRQAAASALARVGAPTTKPPAPISASTRPPMETPLAELPLPTRMANWAELNGLTTVRQLVGRSPSDLLSERNLGRGSIAETRAILEALLGKPWESATELNEAVAGPPSAPDGSWDAVRRQLTDDQRSTPLSELELPARVRTYIETQRLVTLGELAERSAAVLASAPNLSRRSVGALPAAIADHFARIQRDRELVALGLFEGFRTLVQQEEPMLRIILTRRSGMAGKSETLQSLGETFGITRERIRQLEAKVTGGLARRPWGRDVATRVRSAVLAGAKPLALLAIDTWWTASAERPEVLRYVCETVLDDQAFVIDWDDEPWLSPVKAAEVHAVWNDLFDHAERISLPAPCEMFEALINTARERVSTELGDRLGDRLREKLQTDQGRVVAIGDTRRAEMLAILRASPEPMHTDTIFARLGGRVHFGDEVVHFGRGLVGLDQHIPDFTSWRDRLAPPVLDVITRLGPKRQWSCSELLDELREEIDVPTWFTPWHLAAVVKRSEGLAYLGRLRVALPGVNEGDDRVFIHEAAEQILRAAGSPLGRDDLIARIRARTGGSDFTFLTLFARPQFVRVTSDEIGLLDRDVPGGASAIADAIEQIEGLLDRRGRGLSAFHAHEEIKGLSADHERWTEALTFSLLRGDGRFRTSQNGAVGLASWESVRVPTRLELARGALEESGGRVSVEALTARIEAHFGVRPTRATVAAIAMHLGAGLDGDWIVARDRNADADAPSAP